MRCPVCGTGTAKKVERKNYPARYNGEPVEVSGVEVFHCADCGEEFLTSEQARAMSVAVKNEVRKKLGLLSPERIAAIREKAGLTQAQLEEQLGLGPKVVVRWESGKVIQGRAADTVLRLLEREPQLVKDLQEIEKQRCKQQERNAPHLAASGPRPVTVTRVGRTDFVRLIRTKKLNSKTVTQTKNSRTMLRVR
jgi:putative zinc finger/helix-turn-helix YgiT family protein